MRHHTFIILLLLLAVKQFSGTTAWAISTLQSVNRIDTSGKIQLFMRFDSPPKIKRSTTGKKIELTFVDTVVAKPFQPPKTDGQLIKINTSETLDDAILNLYFRYPPQKSKITTNTDTGVVILDILPGNQLSNQYPTLVSQFKGLSILNRTSIDTLNPLKGSPYVKDWRSFFLEYERPVSIQAFPVLRLPPFPLATALEPKLPLKEWLPGKVRSATGSKKWYQAINLLRDEVFTEKKEALKERLLLTYAEALVRAGEYKEPYRLLQRIAIQYPDTRLGYLAKFLFLYLRAPHVHPADAYYELKTLVDHYEDIPFTQDTTLLLAELALLAGRDDDAQALLEELGSSQSKPFSLLKNLREGDLFYLKKDTVRALATFRQLEHASTIITKYPFSLAHYSDLLYMDRQFTEAEKHYAVLGDLLNNKPLQDLALFRKAMAQLRGGSDLEKARLEFSQIQDAFVGSHGAMLAQMKQTDLEYYAHKITPDAAQKTYAQLARSGVTVDLREEAAFKQALTMALAEEHPKSVRHCMTILRNFQSGKLRNETMALLLSQLQGVIKQLIKDKKYIEALVLAKKNRYYFQQGWLDTSLLYDLAEAYSQLGLTDQAAQTYQYLFEIAHEAERENIFLPYLKALAAAGRYNRVEEYADVYQLHYPKGENGPLIYFLKVQALYESGQLDKAAKLLDPENHLRTRALSLLGSQVYFALGAWEQVIASLEQGSMRYQLDNPKTAFLLAESYFQTGKLTQAATLFKTIIEKDKENDQVRFRLGQIEQKSGNTQQALKIFQQLAETAKDPLWQKMASEEAGILKLQQ